MFQLIEYQSKDWKDEHAAEHKIYDGYMAIGMYWGPSSEGPWEERDITICPRKASEFPGLITNPPLSHTSVSGNTITFYSPSCSYLDFSTDQYPKSTERRAIPKPKSRVDRYGERKVYEWSSYSKKWVVARYEKVEYD